MISPVTAHALWMSEAHPGGTAAHRWETRTWSRRSLQRIFSLLTGSCVCSLQSPAMTCWWWNLLFTISSVEIPARLPRDKHERGDRHAVRTIKPQLHVCDWDKPAMASLKALLSALTLLALTVDASSGREYFICLSAVWLDAARSGAAWCL